MKVKTLVLRLSTRLDVLEYGKVLFGKRTILYVHLGLYPNRLKNRSLNLGSR